MQKELIAQRIVFFGFSYTKSHNEADMVPDPTFSVASVSLSVPGKGGAAGA